MRVGSTASPPHKCRSVLTIHCLRKGLALGTRRPQGGPPFTKTAFNHSPLIIAKDWSKNGVVMINACSAATNLGDCPFRTVAHPLGQPLHAESLWSLTPGSADQHTASLGTRQQPPRLEGTETLAPPRLLYYCRIAQSDHFLSFVCYEHVLTSRP